MRSSKLGYAMLKELTGHFDSIKKTQAEMKVTLSEIKKKKGKKEITGNQQSGG